MNHKKEFQDLLAALGERELSEQERQRLWELIAEDSSRMDEYLSAQQMNLAMSNMEFNVVENKTVENKTQKQPVHFRALAVASIFLIAGGMVWLLTQLNLPSQNNEGEVVVASQLKQEEKVLSPVDAYQKMLSQTPKQGSMNRPPTTFSNAGEHGDRIKFNETIRPILSENCFACHGPDEKEAKGDLRLDNLESAMQKKAIVPGKPDESELIARIMTDDTEDIMPPLDSHKTLSEEDKKLLRQWILEGAEWEEHWAFVKPVKSKLPKEVAANPIDHYIQTKLKELGLQQNEPLDRYALARRLSIDLIGLPPTWEEVETFVKDTSKTALQNYVDLLFSKPQYGEHQARFWMDAARYGDTHGMHLDNYREMWPYRDWVIKAFNQNMPFDQFTIEQLAGDLLPKANDQQLIATGFNRCNSTTSEGGSIPEELNVRYMVDRVETVGTVFMGMTVGCASCHDHKFDPITQKEFYQFGAFFNNTTQPAMDGNQKDTPPVLTLPSDQYKQEWDDLLHKREKARQQIQQREDHLEQAVIAWWNSEDKDLKSIQPIRPNGLQFEALVNDPVMRINGQEQSFTGSGNVDPAHPSGQAQGMRFNTETKQGLLVKDSPTIQASKPYVVSMWLRTPDLVRAATLFNLEKVIPAPKDKKGKKPTYLGLTVKLNVQGGINANLSVKPGQRVSALMAPEMGTIPKSWQHICVRYSGGQSNTSFRISVNGEDSPLRIGSNGLLRNDAAIKGVIKLGQSLETGGLSHVRLYNRWISDAEMSLLAKEFQLETLLKEKAQVKWEALESEEQELLRLVYQNNIDATTLKSSEVLAQTQTRRDYIYSRSTTTLIMEEKKNSQPVAYILERGEYDKRGEKVKPNVPGVFPALDSSYPQNRLGLARWLVDRNHPLTARVTVNRLWASLFGQGLVKTVSDFGTMGTAPSHPELLDWLAVEFMESGWDVQHILRLMVESKTYQQNAVVTADSLEKDSENKWYSRGPRVRMDAEEIRDQALAVSGLLKHQIGGPSVKPYQPSGLWKVVAFAGSNTKDFKVDKGDKLYRRSLYTFWKKTSPPPSMEAFNAPTRENCTVNRERTNTPLQALVLMNDPQFVEAARFLAQRAMEQNLSEEERVHWMLKEVLLKPVSKTDADELFEAFAAFLHQFKASPKIVEELLKVGEAPIPEELPREQLAAWTMVANVVMNRDDFINKD